MPSNNILRTIESARNVARLCEKMLYEYRSNIYESSKGIICIPPNAKSYWHWASTKPARFGSNFEQRFDFWAETKKGMEGVCFVRKDGKLFVPLFRDKDIARGVLLGTGELGSEDITDLMPIFPKAVRACVGRDKMEVFNQLQDKVADLCGHRESWLNGRGRGHGQLDSDYRGKLTPSEREAVSELESWGSVNPNKWSKNRGTSAYDNRNSTYNKRKPQPKITCFGNPERTNDIQEAFNKTAKAATAAAASVTSHSKISGDIFIKGSSTHTFTLKEEKEDMTKASQVKTGMYEVNKDAAIEVGYLNAGRASNKLIKEAARPLLNVMFKPTFMQKIAMKLFKMENPVDVALKHGASDFFCAQLVQAVIEIKGVENEQVRKVTKAGIVQSGYELSKAIPFEDAIDKVVSHLENGASDIAKKLK